MTSITATATPSAWPLPSVTRGKGGPGAAQAPLHAAKPAPPDSTVVKLGGTRSPAADTYAPPATATLDFFSFGDQGPHGHPVGPTRLEYNAYRPDGLAIDATTTPYTVKSTGERLTPDVARKYEALLNDTSRGRIEIFRQGQAQGLSNGEILAQLQAYDRSQPASYRALIGNSAFSDPAQRYTMPTHDEVMGGPVQTE
jgi:hypothetical protein